MERERNEVKKKKEEEEEQEEEEEKEKAKEEEETLHKNTDTFHPSMLLESGEQMVEDAPSPLLAKLPAFG
jgi:hypothetical protein